MREIKKIDVWSLAKIEAIIGVILGLIIGILTFILPPLPGQEQTLKSLGVYAIFLAPIIYAIIGFVSGVVIAFLYNIVAKWVGGIKIKLEDR